MVWFPVCWNATRHIVTLAHEAGHAVVGVLVGRRLHGIQLHTDTSGVTTTTGAKWGLGATLTTFAGYPAPAATAGLILLAVFTSKAYLATGILLAVLVVLLLFTRNMWGWIITGTVIGILALALWKGSPLLTQIVLLSIAALLAAGSYRTIWEERTGRKHGQTGSDVQSLAERTGVPATVWWGLMMIVTTAWVVLPAYFLINT